MNYMAMMKDVLELEAAALNMAAEKLDDNQIERLVELFNRLISGQNQLIFIGVGKSGLIGQKLAATFSSLGLPSIFLHPTEALHGDLGRVKKNDAIVLISKSGSTKEIQTLMPFLDIPLEMRIGLLGNTSQSLAKEVGILLDCSVEEEACLNNQAPTTSTTLAMAMGDAMAVLFEKISGLSKEQFATFHPGGLLGKSLKMRVKDLMWPKNECPILKEEDTLKDAILAMTKIRAGACAILSEEGELNGIIVEGDIRRYFASEREDLNIKISELMNKNPITITEDLLAFEALEIMEKRENAIDILPVVAGNKFLGLIPTSRPF